MPEFTVYVTSGGSYFYTTLNAVAMIFNDGKLIWSVIFLGGMFALITGSWYLIQKNIGSGLMKSHTFLEHGIVMLVVTFIAFVPTRMTVQDIYGNQSATPIDNVPLLISLPATMFSSIGYDAFKALDTTFQGVNGSTMTVSENGFVTPLKLMLAVRGGLEKVAPETYKTWINYIGNCTHNSPVTTGGVLHAMDVSKYLIDNGKDGGLVSVHISQSGTGVVAVQQGYYVSCTEAKALLNAAMESLFASGGGSNPMSAAMRNVNMNMSEANRQAANGQWDWASVENAHNAFQAGVGGSAQSAQEFMKNSLIRNAVIGGFECGGSTLTPADQLLCIQAMNDATQQYSVDAAGRGSWFSKMMLPSMAILQLLFFAFSVVAFLYGILRGAGSIAFIAKYFLFGAWVFSWLPFVAIINAFINWMVIDKMSSSPVNGLTLENYDTYFSTMQNNLALASDLLSATPLITLGFLTGSMYAMSGFAQRLSSTDYMHEKNMAPSTVETGPVVRYGSEFDGNVRTGIRTDASTFESVNVSSALSAGRDSASSRMEESQFQQANAFSQMIKAQSGTGGSVKISTADGRSVSVSNEDMYQTGLDKARQVGEEAQLSHNDQTALRKSFDIGLKVASMGGSVQTSKEQALASTTNTKVQEAISEGFSEMNRYAERYGRDVANVITSDSTSSNSRAVEAAAAYNESYAELEKSSQAYRTIDAASTGIATNLSMDVPQLAAKLANDTTRGANGQQVERYINERYNELLADPNKGELVRSWTSAKVDDWKSHGASLNINNMDMAGPTAQLMALERFGDNEGFAKAIAPLAATRDVSAIDPDRNAGIAPNTDQRSIVQGYSALSGWTDQNLPGAGQGHAQRLSDNQLSAIAMSGEQPSSETKEWVHNELGSKLSNTAAGTILNTQAGVQESLYRQTAVTRAKANVEYQPTTAEEYSRAFAENERASARLGMQLPRPVPAPEIENEVIRANYETTHTYWSRSPEKFAAFEAEQRKLFDQYREENSLWSQFSEYDVANKKLPVGTVSDDQPEVPNNPREPKQGKPDK